MRSRLLCLIALLGLAPGGALALTLGTVAFTPCELESAMGGAVEAECARHEVAENPDDLDGRRIALQMALVPARGRNPEPDLVVMLAGGPGQSALEAYPDVASAFAPLRRHRHVLLVDQRGTGRSNPLKCPLPDWKDPATQTAAALRAQAAACLAQVSGRADPRFYTTRDAVRDLEAVRLALGAPRLNLVGGSYGTRVALEYLRRHPGAVRTVTLDGVVPPELALLQDHAANLDAAVYQIFTACRLDAACFRHFGDPARTLDRLRARLRTAPERAELHDPRTHVPRMETLTETLLAGTVRLYAYQPETAALLPLLISEAARGRPQPLLAQGEILFQRLSDSLAHGMELSVICAEDVPFLAPRPQDAGTLLGPMVTALAREQCAVWPRGGMPAGFKSPVVSGVPALLLSGERDPVTPPRYGEQVLRTLSRGRHFVLRGQGHTVLARGCVPRLLRDFVEAADAAGLEPACLNALGAMPAFTSYQGPEP